MALIDKVNDDIKVAMLAREKEKLEAIRAIKSAILLAQTSGEVITDESELKMLQKLVKQRRESADIYVTQSRQDLADKELFEAKIIETYLPAQMKDDDFIGIIKNIITECGATSEKDMG
ncbi:MAG: GatB/YqeY domain-containing protein, partial [Bacteroidota bacterium]